MTENQSTSLEHVLRIDWSELDLFGHVNNVSFFKYIQSARVNFWEASGVISSFEESKVGPVLASCSCNFRKPLFYPGKVHVHTAIVQIGTTSFTMKHTLKNAENEVVAEAQDIVVLFDFHLNEKVAISNDLRAKFNPNL